MTLLICLSLLLTFSASFGAVIDCSGPIYPVNNKHTKSYYVLPTVQFLSDNLFIVGWIHNRTRNAYRFFTISEYDNTIITPINDQYEDRAYFDPWRGNLLNLSGYYDQNKQKVHLEMMPWPLIATETINIDGRSSSVNVTSESYIINTSLSLFQNITRQQVYFHPTIAQYVHCLIHDDTPDRIGFFIGDTTQYINSIDEIQLFSMSDVSISTFSSTKLCFSSMHGSDIFVLFGLGLFDSKYHLFAVSYKLNGISLVSQATKITSDQMLNASHFGQTNVPICKTRYDGFIVVCYAVHRYSSGGSEIGCNLVNPTSLESVHERIFALSSSWNPRIVIYPNNQLILCYSHWVQDAILCTMIDIDFEVLVPTQQVAFPDTSQNEQDFYFTLTQVKYGKRYRFIMVWQRGIIDPENIGADNNYDYIKMIICQDSEQTLSPTQDPTLYPTPIPSSQPTQIPTLPPTQIPTLPPTQHPTNGPLIKINEEWISKESLNCPEGFTDLDDDNVLYGVYCQKCPDGTAGTYGQCDECGTLQEPTHARTECEFVSPWWLYVIEILSGFTVFGAIGSFLYRKYCKSNTRKEGKDTKTSSFLDGNNETRTQNIDNNHDIELSPQ